MRLQCGTGRRADGLGLLRQRLGRALVAVHERYVACAHGRQLAGLSLQKYVDAVQPSGQAPKVHVQTPSGVCAAKLWPGGQHVLPSLVRGGFPYKNAIAVDMYPWRRAALNLVRIGPACDGQAPLRE